MMQITTATVSAAQTPGRACEDVVSVSTLPDGTVLAILADGAGGSGAGLQAAQCICREAPRLLASQPDDPHHHQQVLRLLDGRMGLGQSTAITLWCGQDRIVGSSVGDSQAWFYTRDRELHLTSKQIRKPLIGSLQAQPVAFTAQGEPGVIVMGSDGLWNYVNGNLVRTACTQSVDRIPRRLLESARMTSGALNDDIAVIALGLQQPKASRRVYTLDDLAT